MEPGDEDGKLDYTESEPGGSGDWDGPNDPIGMVEHGTWNEHCAPVQNGSGWSLFWIIAGFLGAMAGLVYLACKVD